MGTPDQKQWAEARSRAVKTALVLAAVAIAVYVAFILSGVLNS